MVIAAAERPDETLPAAIAGFLTGRPSEILYPVSVALALDIFYSGDAGEWVVSFHKLTLPDASLETAVVNAGGRPEFDV